MKRFLVVLGVVFLLASCQIEGPFSVIYHANANGTSGFVTDTNKYETGDEAVVLENNFTYDGHTFQHWNTKADGTGTSYNAGAKIKISNATITLYAVWEED